MQYLVLHFQEYLCCKKRSWFLADVKAFFFFTKQKGHPRQIRFADSPVTSNIVD